MYRTFCIFFVPTNFDRTHTHHVTCVLSMRVFGRSDNVLGCNVCGSAWNLVASRPLFLTLWTLYGGGCGKMDISDPLSGANVNKSLNPSFPVIFSQFRYIRYVRNRNYNIIFYRYDIQNTRMHILHVSCSKTHRNQ